MSQSESTSATSWIQSHLTALYAGQGDVSASVRDTFDKTFSPGCEVRLDHAVRPLQAFKDDLATRWTAVTHASVAWDADVVSTNDHDPKEPAIVAGAFVVTRTFPFRIRVAPAQKRLHIHFSARVERDTNVLDVDTRRITSFYYTVVDKTPPIHFAVPHTSENTEESGQCDATSG